MRKILYKTSMFFLAMAWLGSASPAFAKEVSTYNLEQSLMKYILCYEAYSDAKQSSKKDVRQQLPKYIKAYREAYAEYLNLLRDADLYQPDEKANNPAGEYNSKMTRKGQNIIAWEFVDNSAERKRIKELLKQGKSYDEIMRAIQQGLPSTPIAAPEQPPCQEDGIYKAITPTNVPNHWGNRPGSFWDSFNPSGKYGNATSNYGRDDDDDDDDEEERLGLLGDSSTPRPPKNTVKQPSKSDSSKSGEKDKKGKVPSNPARHSGAMTPVCK